MKVITNPLIKGKRKVLFSELYWKLFIGGLDEDEQRLLCALVKSLALYKSFERYVVAGNIYLDLKEMEPKDHFQ